MPRGVPEIGKDEWFEKSAHTRRRLVEEWLDKILGKRGDVRANFFVKKALYRLARRYLGVKKLPPEVKRDIDRLLEAIK